MVLLKGEIDWVDSDDILIWMEEHLVHRNPSASIEELAQKAMEAKGLEDDEDNSELLFDLAFEAKERVELFSSQGLKGF